MAAVVSASERSDIQFQALLYVDGARATSTGFSVAVAFPPPGQPPSAWLTGSWVRDGRAKITVGPGAAELAAGNYDMWAKVAGEPERIGAVEVR